MEIREHLFRAQRVDNKEWVYGDLTHNKRGQSFICSVIPDIMYDVIPETVCKYTRLTDKNENKIFEGDIIHNYRFNESRFVFWNDETLTWEMAFLGTKMNEVNHLINTVGLTELIVEAAWGDTPSYEVIGTIFDEEARPYDT